eukprot:Polyplicarium_translucidae@DN387_c0_g1_i1.p1
MNRRELIAHLHATNALIAASSRNLYQFRRNNNAAVQGSSCGRETLPSAKSSNDNDDVSNSPRSPPSSPTTGIGSAIEVTATPPLHSCTQSAEVDELRKSPTGSDCTASPSEALPPPAVVPRLQGRGTSASPGAAAAPGLLSPFPPSPGSGADSPKSPGEGRRTRRSCHFSPNRTEHGDPRGATGDTGQSEATRRNGNGSCRQWSPTSSDSAAVPSVPSLFGADAANLLPSTPCRLQQFTQQMARSRLLRSSIFLGCSSNCASEKQLSAETVLSVRQSLINSATTLPPSMTFLASGLASHAEPDLRVRVFDARGSLRVGELPLPIRGRLRAAQAIQAAASAAHGGGIESTGPAAVPPKPV